MQHLKRCGSLDSCELDRVVNYKVEGPEKQQIGPGPHSKAREQRILGQHVLYTLPCLLLPALLLSPLFNALPFFIVKMAK